MDDEDDRHLLDILGDVEALNDYLHGSNSKTIEEDDVNNAAYGSDGSFFSSDTAGSNSGLKDGSSADFGEDSGTGLQLSSSLSFIEDELGSGDSPGGGDLGGDDQPFDILQKSLLEADITEQTLAQEALLDSQPAPTLVQAPVTFPSLVSGNYGGTVGVVTQAGQFIQGMSPLPNGSTQHIQVLGSFGTPGGVMTLSNLERTPQIVLRPPLAATTTAGTQVFAPTQGHVSGFKNIPLQNIIIQRGPGGTQALVRPIQPKPLQTGAQTVYSVGLQPTASTNVANAPSGQYNANGSIVVQSSLEQNNATTGQFILPGSLSISPSSTTIQNGPTDANASAVQIVAGQSYTATAGGQLILNQGAGTQTWTGVSNVTSASVQSAPGRLTLVAGQGQLNASPVQRLLVTQTANCTSLSPLPSAAVMQEQDYGQSCSSPALKQSLLSTVHVSKPMTQDSTLNSQVGARPALVPLTRAEMILQQLRKDHIGAVNPDKSRFPSFENVLQRLLPYNVFQGAPPSLDEFTQVDEEFELVATQVLNKTQAMVDKYRRLLLVEAERSSPSSEMVMIDRTFNQEERTNLTQDKRMILVDPDGFLEEFCCGVKSRLFTDPSPPPTPPPPAPPAPGSDRTRSDVGSTDSPFRTEQPQPGYDDPGGGGCSAKRLKNTLDLKRTHQQCSLSPGKRSPLAAGHHQTSNDTDSALEAAVNSILEC